MSLRKRLAVLLAMVTAMVLLGAGVASAHVTVNPRSVAPNGFTELTFRAPNEAAKADFTKLEVHLPASNPLGSVSPRPIPGWSISTSRAKLANPIVTDDGTTTEYLASVSWTATGDGIPPGQYQDFDISAGPMPASGSLTFTADQSYSDGSVVKWDQIAKAGAAEPAHPAPVLTIADPTAGGDSGDGAALGLSIAALAAAALAAGLAALGLRRRRVAS
jgi:uncharacterized protein YcnI